MVKLFPLILMVMAMVMVKVDEDHNGARGVAFPRTSSTPCAVRPSWVASRVGTFLIMLWNTLSIEGADANPDSWISKASRLG